MSQSLENTETKKRNTNRISVIEYKDKLFRTEDELKAYKQQELIDLFSAITYSPENAVALIDGLIDNVITTKQKLIDFRDLLKTYIVDSTDNQNKDETADEVIDETEEIQEQSNAESEDESERF